MNIREEIRKVSVASPKEIENIVKIFNQMGQYVVGEYDPITLPPFPNYKDRRTEQKGFNKAVDGARDRLKEIISNG